MTRAEAIEGLYYRGDMTKKDIVDKIYDEHEANLKKAREILEGANLAEIENRQLKARIAKLEAKLDSLAQFLEGA